MEKSSASGLISKTRSTISPPYCRQKFDDRAQSAISISLRSHRPISSENDRIEEIKLRLGPRKKAQNTVNWSETTQICKTLNSPKFVAKYGSPSSIELSPNHILVGTSSGRVAMFNYHQNLDFLLELVDADHEKTSKPLLVGSSVTCVAVSAGGHFVCAGHADGKVLVWEIPQKSSKSANPSIVPPYACIRSVSLRERAASSEVSGHLQGVSINTVVFVGDSHQNIVTSDVSGLVLFHHGFQRLFRKKFASQRLLGYHVASSEDILDRFCVHDCQMLPIGTAPQLTDHIGLLAVITSNLLVVISVCSLNNDSAAYPKTHFKATRPKNVYLEDETTPLGCLSWYPSIRGSKGGENPGEKNAKLAYSWNNVLTILEVDNSGIPGNAMAILADLKDKDRAIPNLQLRRTARWATPEKKQRVLALKWLNSEIVAALVYDPASARAKLNFLYYKDHQSKASLELVGTDDIDSQQVSFTDLSGDSTELELRFYNSSLRILRHRPVVLVDSHTECGKSLLTGATSKWADRLVALISKEDFIAALICAYDFYCSDNVGQLLLNGLPHTEKERHEVVEPFLMDIMRESIVPVFTGTGDLSGNVSDNANEDRNRNRMGNRIENMDENMDEDMDENMNENVNGNMNGKMKENMNENMNENMDENMDENTNEDSNAVKSENRSKNTKENQNINQNNNDRNEKEDFLWLYFHLIKTLIKDKKGPANGDLLDILQTIHEIVDNQYLFFDVLESFILTRDIKTLPPAVFKCLVETYVERKKGERLTEIICILDSKSLNIDLTLRLCEAYGLRECLVFIWTSILGDFVQPLFMLMADLDSELGAEQKKMIYVYLSYALSGRLFPTDNYMSADEEDTARFSLCEILFSLQELGAPEYHVTLDTSSVFPYLYKLLRFNAFETLATLNEFFENAKLNTEVKGALTRQYVVEALLDIFRENKNLFDLHDRVHLAIFIARNYPKYYQFIRISDSVLENTVETLCNSPPECHSDAELALESLLPVYDVKNEDFFLNRIKAAHFDRVAFELSRAKQRYASALEIWIDQQKNEDSKHHTFAAFAEIVSHTFASRTVSSAEKNRSFHIVETNFDDLISKFTKSMVGLANSSNPAMHSLVLRSENEGVAFEYLRDLFEEADSPNYGPKKADLLVRYISLSCKYAREKLCVLVDQYFIEISKHSKELESLKESLRDLQCFDALAIISRNSGDYETAIQELTKGVLLATKTGEWTRIDDMISVGISICEKNMHCWPQLVQTLVSLKEPAESASKVPDSINQNIYRCFRKVIDTGERKSDPVFFTDILQGVMDQATLSQVRDVIQETFSSFYFDSEIHKITLSKLNTRIQKYMDEIQSERLQGWFLKKKDCDSCGKPMWGGKVSDRHVAAWESREKSKVFGTRFEKDQYKDCEITLFKCMHGYHSQCLERLGSVGECVICLK